MMKTMRYLLIVILAWTGLSSSTYAAPPKDDSKLPVVEMQSIAPMVGSGTTLPMAALDGVDITNGEGTWVSPETHKPETGLRKWPSNPGDPGTPIGDAMIPLALLALGYAVFAIVRRRRRA